MITSTLHRAKNNYEQIKKRFNWSRRITQPFRYGLQVADGELKLAFYPKIKAEFYRYATFFTKEAGTIAWLENTIQADDIFYDIGANLGLYSLYAAKLKNNVKVYAFEPHKYNFAALMENVKNNGLLNAITPISIPLSDTAGLTKLYYKSLDNGGSMNQLGSKDNTYQRDFNPSFEEIIYAMPLDDFTGDVIPFPTVVKIDVDGIEPAILKGMGKILSSPNKPRSVQIEINPGCRAFIYGEMQRHGYKLDHEHHTSSAEAWEKELQTNDIPYNAVFTAS